MVDRDLVTRKLVLILEDLRLLGPVGVLDAPFAQRLAACAGLRNRIAHDYDELDARKVFAGVESALRDVPMYAAAVRLPVDI